MNTNKVINFALGAAIGYYFVKHWLKVGTPA